MKDLAWELYNDSPTNYRLKDKDIVFLQADTKGHGKDIRIIPKGTLGVVVLARTPRVTAKRGQSLYFANVDVNMGDEGMYRIRVPHGALKVVRPGKE